MSSPLNSLQVDGFIDTEIDLDATTKNVPKPPKKSSKWTSLRTIVKSGNFNRLLSSGRRTYTPTNLVPLGSDDLSNVKKHITGSEGLRPLEQDTTTPRNSDKGVIAIRSDISGGLNQSVLVSCRNGSLGDESTLGDEVRLKDTTHRPLLTKASSFNSNNGGNNQVKSSEALKSCAVPRRSNRGVTDNSNACPLCCNQFNIMHGVKKHRCGKCGEIFCGDCSHKISHIFAFPCKINSTCICQNCG